MNVTEEFRPWFEKYPGLFKTQTDILNLAGFGLDKEELARKGRIQFVGYSKVDPNRRLFVVFPNAFPSSPPRIFDAPPSKPLLRHHRINDRFFCLFGFNGARWSATRSVADALAEVEELISAFKDDNPDLASQPPEPVTRAIRYELETAFLVPPPISTFNQFAGLKFQTGKFRAKFICEGDQKRETRGRGILLEADFGGEKLQSAHPFRDYFGNNGKEIHGDWFYLKDAPTQEGMAGDFNRCFKQIKAAKKAEYYWLAFIFNEEAGVVGKSRLAWLVARANAAGQFHMLRTFPYVGQDRYVRIPGLAGLEQKRVILIGCGSLGSKIAANLAASGVNNFTLVDYDHFEPNNSVRHELGAEYFGILKVKALTSRLQSLNPAVAGNIKLFNFQVGTIYPISDEEEFQNLVKESDLIIDATAVHSVSHFLNDLSNELRVPALYVSVTNGAWGGEVVRVVPGKTPCWTCWNDQYYDQRPPSAPKDRDEVFAPGCDQPTFTGATHELGMVANLATSMAIDTLLGTSDFSKNYIRWSGKDQTGQTAFLTEMLPTSGQVACWWCGSQYGI